MRLLENRNFGKTGMRPTAIGLGGAAFGGNGNSDAVVTDAIHCAIDLGINYLDTSPLYGESERRVGMGLKGGWREKIYLQTKTGTHPHRWQDYTEEGTRWTVENSLRLLRTDYLDSVLIHDPPDIETPLKPGAALDTLLKLKEQGVIGHVGLGVRQHDFHRRAIETDQIEIVISFLDYTLLSQTVAQTTLPLAREKGVGMILASALASGQLAGPEPSDPKAHTMWTWCRNRGVSLRALALQFVMAAPMDGIALPGPANRKEVEEVYEAATVDIAPEVWRDFKTAFGVGL